MRLKTLELGEQYPGVNLSWCTANKSSERLIIRVLNTESFKNLPHRLQLFGSK